MASKHAQTVAVSVVEIGPHVARPITWHVTDCSCGWMSALYVSAAEAGAAHREHCAEQRDKRK